jgi:hypothetical protein
MLIIVTANILISMLKRGRGWGLSVKIDNTQSRVGEDCIYLIPVKIDNTTLIVSGVSVVL